MIIELGMQPNCSEIVYQLCGVTKEIGEKIKDYFKDLLWGKYNKDYLNSYAEGLFAWDYEKNGKYHLALYTYDGGQTTDDWDVLCKSAEEFGIKAEYVSCCSQPIDSEEQMEKQIKWSNEQKEKKNEFDA